jgi:magnesium chelatase subunit I
LGKEITDQQAWTDRDGVTVHVPAYLKDVVEEISRLARTSPHVNQASGVSVRMSIANYENLISSSERRALLQGSTVAVPRLSDLYWLVASSRGKLELSLTEDVGEEDGLIVRVIEEAIKNVFDERLSPKKFGNVVDHFNSGQKIEVSAESPAAKLLAEFDRIKGFSDQIRSVADGWGLLKGAPEASSPDILAGVGELILEGLYGHNRLNKKPGGGGATYSV